MNLLKLRRAVTMLEYMHDAKWHLPPHDAYRISAYIGRRLGIAYTFDMVLGIVPPVSHTLRVWLQLSRT